VIHLLALLFSSRISHIRIYTLYMCFQSGRPSLRRRVGFQGGEEVDHGQQDISHLQVCPLRQWRLDDAAQQMSYACEVMHLYISTVCYGDE
jgi:hypothetical protein